MKPDDEIRVLDHGYVRFVSSMGTDETIIEAARMSTGRGFEGWGGAPCAACDAAGRLSLRDHLFKAYEDSELARESCSCKGSGKMAGDERLLAFLWNNKHATPFEMCEMHIEVMAPIFVFREWHRHRTQSYNEMSARYTPLPDLNYIPSVERLLVNSKTNKQSGTIAGAAELDAARAEEFREGLLAIYDKQERLYQWALSQGVPKELARVHLPVGRYSKMRAKTDLRNWLAFLSLRMAPGAQWEIRQYANAVAEIVKALWPRTFALFTR